MEVGDIIIPNEKTNDIYSYLVTQEHEFIGEVIQEPEDLWVKTPNNMMWVKVIHSIVPGSIGNTYKVNKESFDKVGNKLPTQLIRHIYEKGNVISSK